MVLTWPIVIALVLLVVVVVIRLRRARRPAQRRELRAVEGQQFVIVHHAAETRQVAEAAKAETETLRERVAELERRAA